MGLVVAFGAIFKLLGETLVLLDRVVQFAEGVAQFEAAAIELKPLDPIGIVWILFGERGDGGRKLIDNGGLD